MIFSSDSIITLMRETGPFSNRMVPLNRLSYVAGCFPLREGCYDP